MSNKFIRFEFRKDSNSDFKKILGMLCNFEYRTDLFQLHKDLYIIMSKIFNFYVSGHDHYYMERSYGILNKKFNQEIFEKAKLWVDRRHCNSLQTINFKYFDFIKSIIPEEELYFDNRQRKITKKELQYYFFRLTLKLLETNGYQQIAVNYFIAPGFPEKYKEVTNRSISTHKIAHFNKLLHKYNLINVFEQKNNKNMFILGEENPFYYVHTVNPEEGRKLIDNFKPVNPVKPETEQLKERIKQLEIAQKENATLKNHFHCSVAPVHRPFNFDYRFSKLLKEEKLEDIIKKEQGERDLATAQENTTEEGESSQEKFEKVLKQLDNLCLSA